MAEGDARQRRDAGERDRRVTLAARVDEQAAQLALVQDHVAALVGRLQELAERGNHAGQAGELARMQEQLVATQAHVATLETQVQQMRQGAAQALERITQLELHAGEVATARLRIAELERRLQPLEAAQGQSGLFARLFRRV